MELYSNTVRQRIYNIVVDELTRKLRHRGYKVRFSQAYPEDDQPKFIIWTSDAENKAYSFVWDVKEDKFELNEAVYHEENLNTGLVFDKIERHSCLFEEIPEEEIDRISSLFLTAEQRQKKLLQHSSVLKAVSGPKLKGENTYQFITRYIRENKEVVVATGMILSIVILLLRKYFNI